MSRLSLLRAPLPLLTKELIEQAARRRTYILRAAYALMIFVFFGFLYADVMGGVDIDVGSLGRGGEMLGSMVGCQVVGIYVFLPAMMATTITREKEQHSLSLLLTTSLRPWEIVVQKYMGRLVPMLSMLLLSLPPLGLCYAYGGIELQYVLLSAGGLLAACLFVGSVSIMCSSYYRTSVGAVVWAYVLCGLVSIGALIAVSLGLLIVRPESESTASIVVGLSALGFVVLFLRLASSYLVSRAFVLPEPVYREPTPRARSRRGKARADRDPNLPDDRPIAWREGNRRGAYALRHPWQSFAVLLLPVMYPVGVIALLEPASSAASLLAGILFAVWIVAALLVVVLSAGALPSERMAGTLDVLLTTPLTGREILRQKLEGVRRLILVLFSPLLGVMVLKAIAEWRAEQGGGLLPYTAVYHLAASFVCAAVFLPLLAWGALYVSLRARTRYRALLAAIGAVAAWSLGPVLVVGVLTDAFAYQASWFAIRAVGYLSPGTAIAAAAVGDAKLGEIGLLAHTLIGFALNVALLLVIRHRCLKHADAHLGRVYAVEDAAAQAEGAAT